MMMLAKILDVVIVSDVGIDNSPVYCCVYDNANSELSLLAPP